VSRVKCSNCQQMGHFKSKCPNPLVPEDEGDGGFGGGGDNGGFGDGGFGNGDTGNDGFGSGAAKGDADDWDTGAASGAW